MCRIKLDYSSGSRATYDRFCLKYPEVKISFKEWQTVVDTHNGLYRDYIIQTGDSAAFTPGVGKFSIQKVKNKRIIGYGDMLFIGFSCDFQKSKRLGKKVYHLNAHSDGYNYRWRWHKPKGPWGIAMVDLWYFIACRKGKRNLAAFAKLPDSPAKRIYKEMVRKNLT